MSAVMRGQKATDSAAIDTGIVRALWNFEPSNVDATGHGNVAFGGTIYTGGLINGANSYNVEVLSSNGSSTLYLGTPDGNVGTLALTNQITFEMSLIFGGRMEHSYDLLYNGQADYTNLFCVHKNGSFLRIGTATNSYSANIDINLNQIIFVRVAISDTTKKIYTLIAGVWTLLRTESITAIGSITDGIIVGSMGGSGTIAGSGTFYDNIRVVDGYLNTQPNLPLTTTP
jgi:hypothetical protein